MTTHHKYGPSQLANFEACEGFLSSQKNSDHPNTLLGSRVHDAIEHNDPTTLVSDEEREMYEEAQRLLRFLPAGEDTHELKVHIADLTFGTLDLVRFVSPYSAILVDWKCGVHPIADADHNPQGQAYAVGLFERYPDLQEITVIFARLRYQTYTHHKFTRHDLPRMAMRVRKIIHNASQNRPENYRQGDHCLYCARIDCPLMVGKMSEVVKKYEDIEIPGNVHSSEEVDAKKMGVLLSIARYAEKWAESVKYHAQEFYNQTGEEPEGFEARERAGRRSITIPTIAFAEAEALGVPRDEMLAAAKLSLSDVEKVISDHAPRGKKKKNVGIFYDRLKELDAIDISQPTTTFKKL